MIFMAVFVAVVTLAAVFGFFFHVLLSRPAQHFSPTWLDTFSVERYAPMQRLLDKSDLRFLESQPGYHAEIGRRLMIERRKMFRDYLRMMIRDFNQLIGIGKLMLVYARQERPELAENLWRQQLSFYTAVFVVQCKLTLLPLGSCSIDVAPLVDALRSLGDEVHVLVPHPAAVSAARV